MPPHREAQDRSVLAVVTRAPCDGHGLIHNFVLEATQARPQPSLFTCTVASASGDLESIHHLSVYTYTRIGTAGEPLCPMCSAPAKPAAGDGFAGSGDWPSGAAVNWLPPSS